MKKKSPFVIILTIFFFYIGIVHAADHEKKGQDFYFYPSKTIVINKEVKGDVLIFGGDVLVNEDVSGNISVVKGSVIVGKGKIQGDVVVVGGTLSVENSGEILGSKVVLASIIKDNRMIMLLFSSIFWLITIGFGYLFFPKSIKENAFEFRDDFLRAFFLGIYSTLLLLIMMFIAFILVKIYVGIFLFFAVSTMVFILYVFSLLTIFHYLGELVLKKLFGKNLPGLLFMIIGLIIYQSLSFFGIIGFVVNAVLISGSLGATLLSRFGTFKPWFGVSRHWS